MEKRSPTSRPLKPPQTPLTPSSRALSEILREIRLDYSPTNANTSNFSSVPIPLSPIPPPPPGIFSSSNMAAAPTNFIPSQSGDHPVYNTYSQILSNSTPTYTPSYSQFSGTCKLIIL